jgi:hypothetical protein
MTALSANPIGLVAALVAAFLMVAAGVGKKRLLWRSARCPVCRHTSESCTCRWL